MPANFSAVSENEMTYVMGGAIADYLAPVMEAAQWKKFNQNMVTIVGNKYLTEFLTNTVGAVFSGAWVPGNGLKGFGNKFSAIWDANYGKPTDAAGKVKGGLKGFGSTISGIWSTNYGNPTDTKTKVLTGMKGVLNVGLNIVGNLAAIYNLGFGTVKNVASESTFVEAGAFKF